MSNTCTNLYNNMLEEKAGSRSRIQRKDSKRMSMPECGGNCWVSARPVFKGGWPDSENSKLVKAPTVPKVTSRNSGHAAGAH